MAPDDWPYIPEQTVRREVEVSFVREEMPTVADILRRAEATPAAPRYVCASDYCEAVYILRTQKNFSWREVEEWFTAQGVPFSKPSLIAAYNRWHPGQS